jgi:hypothetical protein
VTYGLVALTTLLAVAAYFYFRAGVRAGEQADPNPQRRIMVGTVWVPVYINATYIEPEQQQEKAISTGGVKFRTKDSAAAVLTFYQDSLRRGGFVTLTPSDNGGTVQVVQNGGRTSVRVTVTSGAENTTGEIRTLNHVEPRPK